MVSREIVSKLLGAKACSENDRDERVCIYANLGSDGRVFIKIVVDGEKVAYARFDPDDVFTIAAVAALAKSLDADEIEELWDVVKGAKKKKNREEKARRKNTKRAARRRRAEEETEEEPGEPEEGEERGEEEEGELEFA